MLEATKAAVLAEKDLREKGGLKPEPFLLKKAGLFFYNTSPLDLKRLMGDQDHIGENLRAYVQAFSPAVRDIFESFDLHAQIDKLAKAGLLYLVTEKFANIDLHPAAVSNAQMGAVFEELIRKFAELFNETAGEHFTPREVIRLMVNLLFVEDDDVLSKPGVVRSLYDPTAGTGGMLTVGGEHLAALNPDARLVMYGQELNPESYDISTYVWIVSNRKPAARRGKVQLIDASSLWQKMRKTLGSKRKELSPTHIEDITRLFGGFEERVRDGVPISRIFRNEDFGYRTITVERPERARGRCSRATRNRSGSITISGGTSSIGRADRRGDGGEHRRADAERGLSPTLVGGRKCASAGSE